MTKIPALLNPVALVVLPALWEKGCARGADNDRAPLASPQARRAKGREGCGPPVNSLNKAVMTLG